MIVCPVCLKTPRFFFRRMVPLWVSCPCGAVSRGPTRWSFTDGERLAYAPLGDDRSDAMGLSPGSSSLDRLHDMALVAAARSVLES